jgi:hypothetical protein
MDAASAYFINNGGLTTSLSSGPLGSMRRHKQWREEASQGIARRASCSSEHTVMSTYHEDQRADQTRKATRVWKKFGEEVRGISAKGGTFGVLCGRKAFLFFSEPEHQFFVR